MTIDVQLTADDYVEAAQALAAPTRRWLALLAVFVAVAVLNAAFLWLTKRPGDAAGVVAGIAGGALIGWQVRRRAIVGKARQAFQQQSALHRPYRVAVTNDSLTVTGDSGESTIAWNGVRSWRDLDRQLLILLSSDGFLLIPKRAFDGPEQMAEFRELLAGRIGVSG